MEWTCKKCGRKMDVSVELLAKTDGTVVCPQCLATDVVPRSRYENATRAASKKAADQAERPAPPPRRKPQQSSSPTPVPPPYRKRSSSYQSTAMTSPQTSRPTSDNTSSRPEQANKKRNTARRKKRRRRGCLQPHSALGCLWRSVVITLIMMALYIFVGLIFEGV